MQNAYRLFCVRFLTAPRIAQDGGTGHCAMLKLNDLLIFANKMILNFPTECVQWKYGRAGMRL